MKRINNKKKTLGVDISEDDNDKVSKDKDEVDDCHVK